MTKDKIFAMPFSTVYPLYVRKAQKKGRSREEVDQIIRWLTGYDAKGLKLQLAAEADFRTFFSQAPRYNENAALVTGSICGVRIEELEDPLMRKIRVLDKLVDELAKGKAMDKILRKELELGKVQPGQVGTEKLAAQKAAQKTSSAPVLLAGGNPQIPKGEGQAPIDAYLSALSGWKAETCRSVDALFDRLVPGVKKAMKWNSPFYGLEGRGWFLSIHVFTKYVKLTFFKGASLPEPPPGSGKDAHARWLDLHEGEWCEGRISSWIRAAAAIPGWNGT